MTLAYPPPYHTNRPGSEPGINPGHHTSRFAHLREDCVIDVTEYTTESVQSRRLSNHEFIEWLTKPPAPAVEETSKPVRWINIGGIDWTVLSSLALKYNLHALALEDVLHERHRSHNMADYYHHHLFLRVACFTIVPPCDEDRLYGSLSSSHDRRSECSDTSAHSQYLRVAEQGGSRPEGADERTSLLQPHIGKAQYLNESFQRRAHALARRVAGLTDDCSETEAKQALRIRASTKGDRICVLVEPMFIFFLRDGTVITICPEPTLEYTTPINQRLQQPDSLPRATQDPSILVESLLDLIVDRVLEVTNAYQAKIKQLEHDTLFSASMRVVRSLHLISGDLAMHRRKIEPLKTLIGGLRLHDVERCVALSQHKIDLISEGAKKGGVPSDESVTLADACQASNAKGYFSYSAKVYLADVEDHMDFALSSLDMFSGIAENLTNYAFNMASYEMNETMRRLTLVTMIFLPPSLLTGYFGMNFISFPSVQHHSELFFWSLAIPMMLVLVPLFIWPNLHRAYSRMEGMVEAKRVVQKYRRSRC